MSNFKYHLPLTIQELSLINGILQVWQKNFSNDHNEKVALEKLIKRIETSVWKGGGSKK